MTEQNGPGQRDKAAAEARTAEVAAAREADARAARQERERREAATSGPGKSVDPQLVKRGADGDSAAERVQNADGDLTGDAPEVVDPFPAYEARSLDELRSLAKSRKVEINRDVEKAHLVALLRGKEATPAWDLMPLEQLREKASENGVELDAEWEFAQLVTELRAADTHTG